jgi:hypothetical protein
VNDSAIAAMSYPVNAAILSVGVVVAAASASAWGQCAIVKEPVPLSGSATLIGTNTSKKRHLHANVLRTFFAFRCNGNAQYSIAYAAALAGAPLKYVVLVNGVGQQFELTPRLMSVGGKPINVPFGDLPATGYSDTAQSGRIYEVVVDLEPIDQAVTARSALGNKYTGNFQIALRY